MYRTDHVVGQGVHSVHVLHFFESYHQQILTIIVPVTYIQGNPSIFIALSVEFLGFPEIHLLSVVRYFCLQHVWICCPINA